MGGFGLINLKQKLLGARARAIYDLFSKPSFTRSVILSKTQHELITNQGYHNDSDERAAMARLFAPGFNNNTMSRVNALDRPRAYSVDYCLLDRGNCWALKDRLPKNMWPCLEAWYEVVTTTTNKAGRIKRYTFPLRKNSDAPGSYPTPKINADVAKFRHEDFVDIENRPLTPESFNQVWGKFCAKNPMLVPDERYGYPEGTVADIRRERVKLTSTNKYPAFEIRWWEMWELLKRDRREAPWGVHVFHLFLLHRLPRYDKWVLAGSGNTIQHMKFSLPHCVLCWDPGSVANPMETTVHVFLGCELTRKLWANFFDRELDWGVVLYYLTQFEERIRIFHFFHGLHNIRKDYRFNIDPEARARDEINNMTRYIQHISKGGFAKYYTFRSLRRS
jgi:hypothetical protein